MRPFVQSIFALAALSLSAMSAQQFPAAANLASQPLYFKVQLGSHVKLSSLKPGDVAKGELARDVYSANGRVFSAGSRVTLSVDHLERRRKPSSNRWPWVVRVFMPRYQNLPAFNDATISAPDGAKNSLHVSLISAAEKIDIHALSSRKKGGAAETPADLATTPLPAVGPTIAFEANAPVISAQPFSSIRTPVPVTLPAGTICRILLLDDLLSSKNKAGDSFRARLLEPLVLESHPVVPAGSLFEGKVARDIPPRWLSRGGSLSLTFTSITLPDGVARPITASVVGVELNRGSHTRLDAEGRLRGERPGAAWMLIDGGVTGGIAKEVDDGTQLVLEAILSSATDASTAGTARIAGTIVSGIFLLTRHGRDVVLPNHTEMSIMLDRPVTFSSSKP